MNSIHGIQIDTHYFFFAIYTMVLFLAVASLIIHIIPANSYLFKALQNENLGYGHDICKVSLTKLQVFG